MEKNSGKGTRIRILELKDEGTITDCYRCFFRMVLCRRTGDGRRVQEFQEEGREEIKGPIENCDTRTKLIGSLGEESDAGDMVSVESDGGMVYFDRQKLLKFLD